MKKSFIARALTISNLFLITLLVHIDTAFAVNDTAEKAKAGIGTLNDLITTFTTTIVKSLGSLLLAAAVVAFFWGVVQYIWGQRKGDKTGIDNGRNFMLWGLIALFVMFSVYGIIKFGQGILFGNTDMSKIVIPEIDFGKSPSSANQTDPLRPATAGDGSVVKPPTAGDGSTTKPPTSNGPAGNSGGGVNSGSNGGGNYENSNTGLPSDQACTRANGGRCTINGEWGSCSDWTCIPDSASNSTTDPNATNYDSGVRATPPADSPCSRQNGGSCVINGVFGSCSDWTCVPN